VRLDGEDVALPEPPGNDLHRRLNKARVEGDLAHLEAFCELEERVLDVLVVDAPVVQNVWGTSSRTLKTRQATSMRPSSAPEVHASAEVS